MYVLLLVLGVEMESEEREVTDSNIVIARVIQFPCLGNVFDLIIKIRCII